MDEAIDRTHAEAVVNGVRLHYVAAGDGPPVVLLHGFPEFWYSWRHQLPALAAAGFRVVAPDMRGYNRSEKPVGVAAYDRRELVADVVGLIHHLGAESAAVVGHDWGGVVGWELAMARPDVVDRLVVCNAPHPATYRRGLRRPSQLLRAWYVFAFQLPLLPELAIRAGDYRVLTRALREEPVRPGAFDAEDIRRYRDAIDRPGALTAAINYYRAAVPDLRTDFEPVEAPVLVVWGERDRHLDVELTEGIERWAPNARVERLPAVSHWVQSDAPGRLNALLTEFLRADRSEARVD